MTRSTTSARSPKAPDCRSMASTSVVLPWSTCATIATLRRSERIGIGLLKDWWQKKTPNPANRFRRRCLLIVVPRARLAKTKVAPSAPPGENGASWRGNLLTRGEGSVGPTGGWRSMAEEATEDAAGAGGGGALLGGVLAVAPLAGGDAGLDVGDVWSPVSPSWSCRKPGT